jgi:hypothetical protein
MGSERNKQNFLITSMNGVAAVFVFANSVVIIEQDGSTMVIDRYNGELDGHTVLGSL